MGREVRSSVNRETQQKWPRDRKLTRTELLVFKNGEHHSESASTLDRDITPLRMKLTKCVLAHICLLRDPLAASLLITRWIQHIEPRYAN